MNPYQAIMGAHSALQGGNEPSAMPGAGGPLGAFQAVLQRARQMAGCFRDPQQMVRQVFPDAPAEAAGDPEQLVNWLQQTGRVTPQMVQTARQIMGGR